MRDTNQRTDAHRNVRLASAPSAGFTLLELLTVLTLFSILLGIGVGAFKKINLGRALAVAQVKDALRAARLFAIEQSSLARVDIDPEKNTIRASGFQSTGNWHFEDDRSRGWPNDATLSGGATLIEEGAIGRAIFLAAGDAGVVDLGRSPSFDADAGLKFDAFVRIPPGGGGLLVEKGEAFRLMITPDRTAAGSVRVRQGEASGGDRDDMIHVETSDPIPLDRWSRVEMIYDGFTLRLSIDGRERARLENQERLDPRPDPAAELTLGSLRTPFVGGIDEVRFALMASQDVPPLPDGVTFAGAGTVWFDRRGNLDGNHHRQPVTISLLFDENRRSRDVVVGLLGEIQ